MKLVLLLILGVMGCGSHELVDYSGHATPMTFRLTSDGKQFIVIAAGGHRLFGKEPGDALIAFALPE